ncbi:MAG: hypothetical protein FWC14_07685 [Candidatus Bathyarchaeota archaeon]|uniref:hypothetical protein n=1 Tax=Candidatus Bathycorpusculum sp. TaxID=2994959 RepID=UPI002823AABA|nr:hypothetical protein [Candidatus Termiticorpusculum sp.]MCL2291720.1 hypothetical protein [Candidatus Termiticorpusculum sp.]
MNLKLKHRISPKQIAIIIVFSAIYAAMRVIPTFPLIGLEGGYFSIADILAPIYGIILGPYTGGISVIIGTAVGMFAKPPVFLGLDFLPALVNTVALGFLVRKKWLPAVILNAVLLAAFVFNPLTLNFVDLSIDNTTLMLPFVWMHIIAFLVLLSPLGMKAGKWVRTAKQQNNASENNTKTVANKFMNQIRSKATVGFVTLVFIGTMIQHLMGNILYENIFVHVTKFMTVEALTGRWMIVAFLYPWERLVLIIFATAIGLPLLYVLKKTMLIRETNKIMIEEDQKTKND